MSNQSLASFFVNRASQSAGLTTGYMVIRSTDAAAYTVAPMRQRIRTKDQRTNYHRHPLGLRRSHLLNPLKHPAKSTLGIHRVSLSHRVTRLRPTTSIYPLSCSPRQFYTISCFVGRSRTLVTADTLCSTALPEFLCGIVGILNASSRRSAGCIVRVAAESALLIHTANR